MCLLGQLCVSLESFKTMLWAAMYICLGNYMRLLGQLCVSAWQLYMTVRAVICIF